MATNPNLLTACDRQSALNRAALPSMSLRANGKKISIISLLSEIWEKSQFIPSLKNVYGYQHILKHPFAVLESLNFCVDNMAKKIALKHVKGELQLPNIFPQQWAMTQQKCMVP